MRTKPWLAIVMLGMFGGCFADSTGVDTSSENINKADCDKLGDPYAGCPAFMPTADNCKGPSAGKPWDKDGGWVNGNPICLGFGDKIGTCEKCNHLSVPDADYDKCLNQRFVKCGEAGKLPGQTKKEEMCFVTAAVSVSCDRLPTNPDGSPKWPAGDGAATAREMCAVGPPSNAGVKECREKAKCTEKGKKVGCTCMPCGPIVSVAGGASSTDEGETCSEDCAYDVSMDPMCNPEPSACPSVSPSPSASPSASPTGTVSPSPTGTVSPSPTSTTSPSPTASVSPSPTASVSPSPTSTIWPSPTSTMWPTATASPSPTASATAWPSSTMWPSPF